MEYKEKIVYTGHSVITIRRPVLTEEQKAEKLEELIAAIKEAYKTV